MKNCSIGTLLVPITDTRQGLMYRGCTDTTVLPLKTLGGRMFSLDGLGFSHLAGLGRVLGKTGQTAFLH